MQKHALQLVAPEGGGIHIDAQHNSGYLLIADVSIASDAPVNSPVMLRLQDSNKKDVGGPLAFNITSTPPRPIPPGMAPALDVMWGVVPDRIVHDDFGHYISSKFYCIEVVIGNDTGYQVQIAAVGFTTAGGQRPLPSSGYQTARAMLEVGQLENPLGLIVATLGTLGALGAGLTPFFHNANRKANFTTWVDLVSNPLVRGFQFIVPDLTIPELNRLDEQMMPDNLIIQNNTQVRTKVFIPKAVVLPYLSTVDKSDLAPKTECADPHWHKCSHRTSTKNVMEALGSLRLVGDEIVYLNRVIVDVSSTTPAPHALLDPSSLQFTSSANAPQKVTLTNSGTLPLLITKIDVSPISGPAAFSSTDDCPKSASALAPNDRCTITVSFTPGEPGKYTAELTVSDNANDSPQVVPLSGSWQPSLKPNQDTLSFADQKPQTIFLTNESDATITIGRLLIKTGPNADDFTATDKCSGSKLDPNKSCDITVNFTPTAKGSETTVLRLLDDKGNLVGLVNLTGPGK